MTSKLIDSEAYYIELEQQKQLEKKIKQNHINYELKQKEKLKN